MINDSERREVAARLRSLDVHDWNDFMDEVDSLETAIGCSIGQDWQDQDWWHRLADLIEPEPERTCKMIPLVEKDDSIFFVKCSECREVLFARGGKHNCNYCPNCGAKVVDDD